MIAAAWALAILATCCAAFVAIALNSSAPDPWDRPQVQRPSRVPVCVPRGSLLDEVC